MSEVHIEDAGWQAIMDDERLAKARSKLSFHELRLIIGHARNAGCPFCMGRSSYKGEPKDVFCADHYRQYREVAEAFLDIWRPAVLAAASDRGGS